MHFGLFNKNKHPSKKTSAKNAGKLSHQLHRSFAPVEVLENRRYMAVDSVPWTGTPTEMPAYFQTVNYDLGGEGVAFHDNKGVNFDGFYRASEGVDIVKNNDTGYTGLPGSGFSVADTQAGEFLKYTVNIPTTGSYDFQFRVASKKSGGVFHLEVDGNDATGFLFVPKTGSAGKYKNVKATASVPLTQGTHVYKLVFDVNGSNGQVGNFNWILCNYAQDQTPVTPYQFNVTANGDGSQTLRFVDYWPINTYIIQRTTLGLDSQWETINSITAASPVVTGTPTTWTDFSTVSGNTYFYRVYAANGSGRSLPTAPTSATSSTGGSGALTLTNGSFLRVTPSPVKPSITKFTSAGLVDTSFANNGTLTLDVDQQNYNLELFQLPNGNVLISEVTSNFANSVTTQVSNLLVIDPATGALLQSVNTGFQIVDPKNKNGGSNGTLYNRVAVYANGAVVLAGYNIAATGFTTLQVQRLTAALAPDAAFGANGVAAVGGYGDPEHVVLLGDGRTALTYAKSVLFLTFNGSLGTNFSWNLSS